MGYMPEPIRVILKCNGEEHICKLLPTGWREHSAGWTFDLEQFGYNLKYSVDNLRFVKEDADFIRKCLDLYGISAQIDITIQRRNDRWTFDDFFTGQIDIARGYVNEVDFVEVDVYEGGLKKALEKDSKTNFDTPFDNDAVDIQVSEGMIMKNNVKYENISGYGYIATQEGNYYVSAGGDIVDKSKIYKNNVMFMDKTTVNNSWIYTVVRTNKAESQILTLKTKLDLHFKVGQFQHLHQVNFRLQKLNANYQTVEVIKEFYFKDGLDISDEYYEFDVKFNGNIEILIDDNINNYCLIVNCYADGVIQQGKPTLNQIRGELTFEFEGDELPTFNFKAYRAEKFGQKLLNKIYPNATFQVPFLQQMETAENMQLFITSADAIRGIQPTTELPQGALIKTNLSEFVKNISCLFDLGVQINNADTGVYTLKHKNEIFADVEILDLGEVTKMQTILPDENWFANNIQAGYEKQDYDYPLGRQEFAVTLEFNNDLKVINKKMDLVSKYRADYTGVQLFHFDYVNNDKKDSKSDNDIFWILAFKKPLQISHQVTYNKTPFPNQKVKTINVSVGQTVHKGDIIMTITYLTDPSFILDEYIYAEWTGQITSINVAVGQTVQESMLLCTLQENIDWQAIAGDRISNIQGLEGGGYFNILLSPKAMLMRHARFFASILDKHEKILRYTSSTETMSALEYTDTELGQVTEKADLSVANAAPFFKPLIFEFDCIIKHNLPEILGQNPAGYLKFRYNNLELKGFPIDIEGSTNDSVQTVKCIAHPDTPDNIQEILHKRLPNKLYK